MHILSVAKTGLVRFRTHSKSPHIC